MIDINKQSMRESSTLLNNFVSNLNVYLLNNICFNKPNQYLNQPFI